MAARSVVRVPTVSGPRPDGGAVARPPGDWYTDEPHWVGGPTARREQPRSARVHGAAGAGAVVAICILACMPPLQFILCAESPLDFVRSISTGTHRSLYTDE
jgi:hypothetical protein